MAAGPMRHPNEPKIGRRILLLFAGAFVVALQFALPWLSFNWSDLSNQPGDTYWAERMQFRALFHPDQIFRGPFQIASAAVCNNELNVLLTNNSSIAFEKQPRELVQFNLRTGRAATLPAPENIRFVVSDGRTIWWLPYYEKLPETRWPILKDPFVLGGRPVTISLDYSQSNPCLHRLIEFVEGHWRETDEFALIPCVFDQDRWTRCQLIQHAGSDPSFMVLSYVSLWQSFGDVYYHHGLDTGSRTHAIQFAVRHGRMFHYQKTPGEEAEWHRIQYSHEVDIETLGYHWNFDREKTPFGFWFEQGLPQVIAIVYSDVPHPRQSTSYEIFGFDRNRTPRRSLVPNPIRWDCFRYQNTESPIQRVIPGGDGEALIVLCNPSDGRIHVLRCNGEQLSLVGHRGSPILGLVYLDAVYYLSLAVFIPMALLGLLTMIMQRREGPRDFSFGRETVALATIIRRSFARLVDLSIPVGIVTIPVLFDPDAIGWWSYVRGAVVYSQTGYFLSFAPCPFITGL